MPPAYPGFNAALIVVLVFAGIAAVTDLWKLRVQNLLTIPLMATGVLYQGWVGWDHAGWSGASVHVGLSLAGMGFGFAVLLIPYLMGGMGSGDVKLLMAIGAWLTFQPTVYVFIGGALAAGTCAIVLMFWHRSLSETWWNLRILLHRFSKEDLPLGGLRRAGIQLASDEHLEQHLESSRRGRLIPFGAMLFVGTIGVALWLHTR